MGKILDLTGKPAQSGGLILTEEQKAQKPVTLGDLSVMMAELDAMLAYKFFDYDELIRALMTQVRTLTEVLIAEGKYTAEELDALSVKHAIDVAGGQESFDKLQKFKADLQAKYDAQEAEENKEK